MQLGGMNDYIGFDRSPSIASCKIQTMVKFTIISADSIFEIKYNLPSILIYREIFVILTFSRTNYLLILANTSLHRYIFMQSVEINNNIIYITIKH